MALATPIQTFSSRYIAWASDDARREVAEGLPLLSSVNGSLAKGAVSYLKSLPTAAQVDVLTLRIKRFRKGCVPNLVEIA